LYGQLAGVVAVRLHAAILAIVGGTPVYAIAYFTKKTEGVMAGVGLSDAVADFATVTAEDIVAALPTLMSGETRARLHAGSDQRRDELDERARAWFSAAAPFVLDRAAGVPA
jgi:polysaccharide pyruvyl transferase WcaK-like protein